MPNFVNVVRCKMSLNPGLMERAARMLRGASKRIKQHRAMVGIQEPEGGQKKRNYYDKETALTLAQTMILHEYGTDNLPERSFLRAYFDANEAKFEAGMKDAMQAEFEGNQRAVHDWATQVAAEWKEWIAAGGDFVGLMPRTIAEKEKAGLPEPETPLVATKQFSESWRAKVDGEFVS